MHSNYFLKVAANVTTAIDTELKNLQMVSANTTRNFCVLADPDTLLRPNGKTV